MHVPCNLPASLHDTPRPMRIHLSMLVLLFLAPFGMSSCQEDDLPDALGPAEVMYTLPPKDGPHTSTWLQWPHQHPYGLVYRDDLDPTWVELTRQLVVNEEVERSFTTYLGATHFIWLHGQPGIDITDQHIDGFARFAEPNTVVLVPTYADPNDAVALDILRTVYPGRTVVGIDFRNAYAEGGMTHCVTMQEPVKP